MKRDVPAQIEAIEHTQEGIQVFDYELRWVYLNSAAAQQGQQDRHELVGQRMVEIFPGIDQTEMFKRLQDCLHARVADQMENEFIYPDGSKRWFEIRMEPVPEGVLMFSIDIHRRKRLEEQVHHAQRMEAVGRLAGGVAHDFNNILTVIQACASFLVAKLNDEDSTDAQEILKASKRGSDLTRQLLAISRQQSAEPVVVDVDEAVADIEPMLRHLLGESSELVLALGCNGSIRIGAGQLDQVLLNLTANAGDAMPNGGRLTIRTNQILIDGAYAEEHLDVQSGAYCLVSITDCGSGMSAETCSLIFEPFYTTKAGRGGTGLGLATSHGLIKQAGGHIWVYSELGKGTTFKVYLPLADGATEGPLKGQPAPLEHLTGTETILVVDDDSAVVSLCTRILSALGYTVLGAEGFEDAIRLADHYSGPIHAVVTDVSMPGGSGPELVLRLRKRRPGLPMLYISGYIDDERILAMNHSANLEKPFMPDQLAQKVRALLSH